MISDDTRALLRSAAYSALALGFSRPDEHVASRLCVPEGTWALRRITEALALGAPPPPALSLMELRRRHEELFGFTARGKVPPYETEYGGDDNPFSQAHELADLGAFLSAFGLKSNPQEHERPDHVRAECELMAFLASKQALALERGDEDMLAQTRKAQRLYLRDHLGRFAPAFASRLEREDRGGFYGGLASLLRELVERDCAAAEVASGSSDLGLRVGPVDEAPAACGSCSLAESPA